MQIGFLANFGQEEEMKAEKESSIMSNKKTLYKFDSSRRLSLTTGTRSVLIIGGTGSGKTQSVVLPMIDHMIGEGLSGIIMDVKGNLRQQVRAIAAEHGRLDDIVEFGSHPCSNTTNFLDGLKDYEVKELLNTLAIDGIAEDRNMNFFLHGGKIYFDIYRCLKDIYKVSPHCHFSKQFFPTLSKIYEIVNNQTFASGLWAFYRYSLQLKLNYYKKIKKEPPHYIIDAQNFLCSVKSDNFHVLRDPRKMRNNIYYEQLSYALNHINNVFQAFDVTHNILRKFSSTDTEAIPFDLDKLIYKQKKIVLVHFALDSGQAGNVISKSIKARFYQAVLRNGLNYDSKTFMVGDEFQNIVDVSNKSKLNDMDFFSLSREYKNINIIATQSISSLYAKGNDNAINSLMSNCMTKIMLQSSDFQTNKWLNDLLSDSDYRLQNLNRGTCIIQTFDKDNNLVDRIEELNNEYKNIKEILDENIDIKNIKNKKKPLPYKLGACQFPYVISQVLMTDLEEYSDNRRNKNNYDDYEALIYLKLCYLRELSKKGKKYWLHDEAYENEEEIKMEIEI